MSLMTDVTIDPPQTSPWPRRLFHWRVVLILLDVLIGSTIIGVQAREWFWDYTQIARFRYDINRNYSFGRQAVEEGYLNVYDNQLITNPPEAKKINYTPLRLALFAAWAKWNSWTQENPETWQESHEFNGFLMYYNTSIEWLAAIAALLLVRHWIWRTGPPARPGMTRIDKLLHGCFRGILAFLLVWFNPALFASAHGWPSTDMWVIPFFLWTVLLACWNHWFLAGMVMGIGAMFKGQQLFVVPVFLLWPIFAGEFGKALRWACGFAFMSALILSGWLLSYPADNDVSTPDRILDWPALLWVTTAAAGVLIINGWRVLPKRWRWTWVPVALFGIWLIVRPSLADFSIWTWLLIAVSLAVTAAAIWLPLRQQWYSLGGVVAITLMLCIVYFHGTTGWWELGFMYGTERHPNMVVGPGNNLPALLAERFGWRNPKEVMMTLDMPGWLVSSSDGSPATIDIQIRHFLLVVYGLFMAISCIAIARQWRRNDRRFLVAIIVPWLLLYSIPAQMHERYLLYGSTAAAIVIGSSVGLTFLNLFLVALTFLQTVHCMMITNRLTRSMAHPTLNGDLAWFCERIRPDISWAVLAATAVFFFAAFTRSRCAAPAQKQMAADEPVDPSAADQSQQ